ncbi:54S ribosomal protein L22, mitochondrial [Cadophora gregata]|uniref:54S ribosomal protein L22, mitochondrial n=1 Tax=Cadophora gregata TaxID=51156 RepID=UPI0026DD25F6|nr:54S ribosomal protein L22, mitochondrial [Cadophora gregata]KAK0108236.1 54S ribosomal protein L22, mitochondrial [Cadophora gregata]
MSLHLPSRRVVRTATALTSPQTKLNLLTPIIQRRTGFSLRPWKVDEAMKSRAKPTNPLTEEYLRKKPKPPAGGPKRGSLSSSSIFEDEEIVGPTSQGPEGKKLEPRNPHTMAAALDPEPQARKRWERKMVIRDIHKRGRLTKTQQLKREERVMLLKSHDFKTSVKKLVPLAKQIAGKTVEEAIVQMRFSKKKVAKDVKEHLEHARNEAITRRGMGLGLGVKGTFRQKQILTKDGERVQVEDPTTLYVDEAWCGKGLYGKTPDHRARGQVYLMKNRTTCTYQISQLGN